MRTPGLFVTGTDTGVGKTRVAAAIAAGIAGGGRRVGVLKPVATGATRAAGVWEVEDARALIDALGEGVPVERVAPIVFEDPVAPPVAARRAGGRLEHAEVLARTSEALAWWARRGAEVVVVEGVGGLLCPLAEGTTVADLAVALDLPLVVVARRGLGTLNHTLLTVEAAAYRGLRIAGVVLNEPTPGEGGPAEATNAAELARRLPGVAILAEIAHDPDGALLSGRLGEIDWMERAAAARSPEPPYPEAP
jgi:dethiobiotin synthetase